ncbi:acyl-CoA dehydrogenase [Rhodocytophaga rosea]|uniref:Acyl-CoA dehydrogenase n=1 Tax=Rhodocytophaga rosea TaxID=2704465 RepID=A0A6C0GC60_9BACT|nr:acyl-CoA dehydrogenase [Rhodocytophaga rosea]QHT65477.1 acyl-CoA dehydrogenase [Rhodocytophaga rosea]
MSFNSFSRQHLDFVLYEVLGMEVILADAYFHGHHRETFDLTLDTATEIADTYLAPSYKLADRKEPELVEGQVKVHPAVHQYYQAYVQSGLLSATFPEMCGGQQLPKTIAAGVQYILAAANNSFVMFTDLVKGVANVILRFGNVEQKNTYLPKLLSGEWAATMCLTETQAGSSLSDITTCAIPVEDGIFRITGQKIFISAGDHDITENIVHLVLARIAGAPAGTKGISLFIVLKKQINNKEKWQDNDVASIGIIHKMGQKATPAMHLSFGGNNNCLGYLLGEANQGLQYMFQLMNAFRLEVGLMGVSVATHAYYTSLQYAIERTQGRRTNAKAANTLAVPIIQHPDVRRMLLSQKAFTEGTLAFILQCYQYMDMQKISKEAAQKKHYQDLLELLTPVAKTYGAESGNASIHNALQVLGGYGYTTDFPLEQMARDARIFSIYEGTTGIQSIALLGRQIAQNNGKSIDLWLEQVLPDIEKASELATLQTYANRLKREIENLQSVTSHLLNIRSEKGDEVFLADATLYMQLFGILNIAWQLLRMATIAEKALYNSSLAEDKKLFYRSKVSTMKFFFTYELTKCTGLCQQLMNEEQLTIYNEQEEMLI